MSTKPKPWLAALLGVVAAPMGMLYVAKARWAISYLLLLLALTPLVFFGPWGAGAADLLKVLMAIVAAVHAYRIAQRYPDQPARPGYSRWYGLLGSALALVAIAFGARAFFFEPFRIPSGNMLPTLPVGSIALVQKWGYGNYRAYGIQVAHVPVSALLRRGDIVVFQYPQKPSLDYIKRVIGLPGDEVVYKNKQLSINEQAIPQRPDGEYFDEDSMRYWPRHAESLMGVEYQILGSDRAQPSVPQSDFPFRDQCSYDVESLRCKVPAGHYFVLGDNRDNSLDSRYWGFVPEDHIVGKLVYSVR